MNPKAIALYRSHGIDLYKDLLEISVCAQHCNGGIGVDADWRTNLEGLYVAGGGRNLWPFRPGGSALNSTQVGSMRAAQKICGTPLSLPQEDWGRLVNRTVGGIRSVLSVPVRSGAPSSLLERRTHFQKEMSAHLSHIRSLSQIPQLRRELTEELRTFLAALSYNLGGIAPSAEKSGYFHHPAGSAVRDGMDHTDAGKPWFRPCSGFRRRGAGWTVKCLSLSAWKRGKGPVCPDDPIRPGQFLLLLSEGTSAAGGRRLV